MHVKNKIGIIAAGIVILIVLIIWGTYLIEDNNSKSYQEKTTLNQTNNIEITKKDVSTTITYSASELKPNSKLILSPGQTFKYKFYSPGQQNLVGERNAVSTDNSIVFFVEGIRMINKTKCYKIIGNETKSIEMMYNGKYVKRSSSFKYVVYIDTENGKPIQIDFENTTAKGDASIPSLDLLCVIGKSFYAPWMLALEKDMKWKEDIITTEHVKQESHLEYEVLGIENINKRKCFKVNVRYINKIENNQQSITNSVMWIDVEKSILIRWRLYVDNLLIGEINLIE